MVIIEKNAGGSYPLVLTAHLDPGLSRWRWLVKWLLAIPHYFLLAFLWPAFLLVTVVAGFAILFTGRYPRSLFAFTSGVLRWSWRVAYYAANGGMGTDQYPPFSLGTAPGYPASLDIVYPAALMTDQYPPFRLDQGGTETTLPPAPPAAGPAVPPLPEPAGSRSGA